MRNPKIIKAVLLTVGFVIALVLISLIASSPREEALYVWDASAGFKDWQTASPDTAVLTIPQGLYIDSGNEFPLIASPSYLSIMLDSYDLLVIKLKSSRSGVGNVFWADYQNPRFDRGRSLMFYTGRKDNQNERYIDLGIQEKGWLGRIDALLINPMPGPGSCEIESIRIVKSNSRTKLLAAWQEFWGPRGREIIGSTINTMQSSTIFGRSVYYYLYWLIAVFFILAVCFAGYKLALNKFGGGLLKAWDQTLLYTIGFIFILWMLLEANNLFNQVNICRGEAYLFGKSLDEKRTLVNPPGFYEFIEFCEKKLPPGEAIDIRVSRIYDDIKIKYYLYPHQVLKGAKYILVINQPVEPELLRASGLFAKFSDGSYILKRE